MNQPFDDEQPATEESDPERANAIDEDPSDLHADPSDDWLPSVPAEAPVRSWRLAKSLERLRAQVNAAAPGRSKASDGTIGDAAHASRASDHNPWISDGGIGVVTALDITHDPARGCDAGRLAEALRRSGDRRIKYIISNGRIVSSAPKGNVPAWRWRAYTGSNPHRKHCHISVAAEKALYDATGDWPLAEAFGNVLEAADAGVAPEVSLDDIEQGLQALAAGAGSEDQPLLVRLAMVEEGAALLRSRYSQAVRAFARDEPDDILERAAPRFEDLKPEYERLWANCAIPAAHAGVVAWHRKMLLQGKAHYVEAATRTGVPWWFIGIIHAMEAGFNFRAHLHNGDPLPRQTVQVPKGRPPVWNPPSDWLSSAIDALQYEKFTGLSDWSVPRALYRWEAYNGFGYRRPNIGINTPYLWSFTNHYAKGKYVRDGVYDPNAVSKQCGTAAMLKALQKAGDVQL